ncbi:MAG: hypothetical protein AAGI11_18965 [Pseudomonadota bacterium]
MNLKPGNLKRSLLTGLILVFLSPVTIAEGPEITWDLKDALKQVDRQSDNFDTMMARAEFVRTDREGKETLRAQGTMFMSEKGDIRVDFDGDKPVTYLLYRRYLYIHYPRQNRVEEYYLSRHKGRLEPYLRLGFSTSGNDLKKDFLLTSLGEKDVGTTRTLGLDLTPESSKMREVIGRAQLWIDQASWMPAQQIIDSTQQGATLTVTYTYMARNLNLNPDLFKDKWPRGTDKQKMK